MISPEQKILPFSEVGQTLRERFVSEEVALCYGHFNIIHPGHIRYMEHARTLGTHLVIAVQGDQMQTHSGRSHHFPAEERALGLALLHIVDAVIVLDTADLKDLVQKICPAVLVLGKEFETQHYTKIDSALNALQDCQGKVFYHTGDAYYASSELLEESQTNLLQERKQLFLNACHKQQISVNGMQQGVRRFAQARVLVLGDTIVDQYIACDAIGMSAEEPVLVVRELKAKEFVGGAAIVAAHARALGAQCHYLSVVGEDSNTQLVQRKLKHYDVPHTLITDASRPTTFKIRYLVENRKMFRVSRLKEHSLSKEVEALVIQKLEALAPQMDGILVSDFVYGVITHRILEVLLDLAKRYHLKLFGDLQCSSQIGNIGKFKDFNLLTPTEKEARVALNNRDDGVERVANILIQQTRSKNLLIKLGAEGFIAYENNKDGFINRQHFPALSVNPVDVAGAGDSLLALIAVSLCAGNNLMTSSAMGACMASLATQTVGNVPLSHLQLEQMIEQLYKDGLMLD